MMTAASIAINFYGELHFFFMNPFFNFSGFSGNNLEFKFETPFVLKKKSLDDDVVWELL